MVHMKGILYGLQHEGAILENGVNLNEVDAMSVENLARSQLGMPLSPVYYGGRNNNPIQLIPDAQAMSYYGGIPITLPLDTY